MKIKKINETLLVTLYTREGLSIYKIAKYFDVSPTTIYYRLKNMAIIRSRRKDIDPQILKELYVNKKYSTSDIAEMLNTSKTTVRKKLLSIGVSLRNLSDAQHLSRSKNLQPYNGDPLIKTELLALRITDFSPLRKRRRINLMTATTHAGMLRFTHNVCNKLAEIRCKPRRFEGWEWAIRCSFDDSYNFLLENKDSIDKFSWILSDEELMKIFFTRAIECDGFLCVTSDRDKFVLRIGFVNSNHKIHGFMRTVMEKLFARRVYEQPKKTPRNSIVWASMITIKRSNDNALNNLLVELPWKHPEKFWKVQLAVDLCGKRITEEGLKKIKEVRQMILKYRNKTMTLASEVAQYPKGYRTLSISEVLRRLGI